MARLISFFEIPAVNFNRAVSFYETVFNVKIDVCDCDETELMGFFPEGEGAISFSEQIKPSKDGVLISLCTDNIEITLEKIQKLGGETVIPKTEIQAEGMGFFAVFIDCEGNKLGLHEK